MHKVQKINTAYYKQVYKPVEKKCLLSTLLANVCYFFVTNALINV